MQGDRFFQRIDCLRILGLSCESCGEVAVRSGNSADLFPWRCGTSALPWDSPQCGSRSRRVDRSLASSWGGWRWPACRRLRPCLADSAFRRPWPDQGRRVIGGLELQGLSGTRFAASAGFPVSCANVPMQIWPSAPALPSITASLQACRACSISADLWSFYRRRARIDQAPPWRRRSWGRYVTPRRT